MKNYIRFLENDLILVDSDNLEEVPDREEHQVDPKKILEMKKKIEWHEKMMKDHIKREFPKATDFQIECALNKTEDVYAKLIQKIKKAKELKDQKFEDLAHFNAISDDGIQERIKKYRAYFDAPENHINLKSLIEN